MKTAVFSLVISITILILSLFQFDKYQKNNHVHQVAVNKLEAEISHLKQQEEIRLQQNQHKTFRLLEIQSFVELADAQLQATQSVSASLKLLKAAEVKLDSLNDPSLFSLKKAVLNDLNTLQAVTLPNIPALWQQMNNWRHCLTNILPRQLAGNAASKTSNTQPAITTKNQTAWKKHLQESLEKIKILIKIRRTEPETVLLLSQNEQQLIQVSLMALLEQASLAVLLKENKIFQETLSTMHNCITRYYDLENTDIQALLKAITSWQAINLSSELPVITAIQFFPKEH